MAGVRKAKVKSQAENAFNQALGRRIESLRRDRKLAQTDFARELGISRGQLYNYEVGRDRLPIYLLERAARLLQVRAVELFPDVDCL